MAKQELLGQFGRNSAQTAELFYGDDVKGVVHVFDTTIQRDSVPGATFRTGELCIVTADDSKWKWNGAAWVSYSGFGSAGGGGGMGFTYTFAGTGTTGDADPGAGTCRLNNATLASATKLYIDLLEYGGTDVTAWIDSLDDYSAAGLLGVVRLQSESDATKWIEYAVTGWTTATGYRKLDIAYKDGPGGLLTTAGDTYISFDYVGGPLGYLPVANASARTGLPASKRLAGMLVRENDTGLLYVLGSDLTTWVLADTSTTNQKISRASADAIAADLTLRKARGTEASPAAVNAEDALATRTAQGHDGSAYYDAGSFDHIADAAGGTSKRTRARARLHDGTALVTTEEAVSHRVTTTDATLTVVRSIPLAADSVLRVRYAIVGAQNSSSNRAIRETVVTVRRSGSGDPVVVAYGDSVALFRDDATWGASSEIGHQINTSTDALEIIVKGKAATTIVWRVDIQYGAR